jgi:hypothetical protein
MKLKYLALLITLVVIHLIPSAQPVNDNCSGATWLTQTAYCSPLSGTTVNATQSVPAITCQGLEGYADDDVWYVFTATTHSPFISVDPSSGFDAVVDLRTSPCDGTTIYCSDSKGPGGIENIYTYGLLIGESYYIRIYSYGYGSSTQGTFTVCVYGSPPPPPVNDNCTSTISLQMGPYCSPYPASTISATQSEAPVTCEGATGSADDDVWFVFSPYTSNPTIRVECTPLFDAVIDLREGPCDGTTIFCADDVGAGVTESLYAAGLTTGNYYLIRVYSYGSDPNSAGEFTICIQETVCHNCPDYDFEITPGPDWQTHSSSSGSMGCNIYQFYVKTGKEYTFKTGCGDGATAEFNTYLELFDLNCDSITSDNNSCENNRSEITWVSTYDGPAYLKISGANADDFGSYSLAFKITGPVSTPQPPEGLSLSDLINVYPNPASGAFRIEAKQVLFTKVVINDYMNRINRIFRIKMPTNTFISDDLDLAPGLYILAIETDQGWVHKRLEVVH